jgi:hypothetical protein
MNSGIGGMPIFAICRFIILVASAEKPGMAPIQVHLPLRRARARPRAHIA